MGVTISDTDDWDLCNKYIHYLDDTGLLCPITDVRKYALEHTRPCVFTCETCWEITVGAAQCLEPKWVQRCYKCNSAFNRWKWRKNFRERIPLRDPNTQWLATFTWGQPLINATAEERMITREAMKIAMQKLSKTKLWKDYIRGYIWVYEEAVHDATVRYTTTDFWGNPLPHKDVELPYLTHHPHIHAVLDFKEAGRLPAEDFEKLKNHFRKYFSKYVWLKPITGRDGPAKAINYTLKYIGKDLTDYGIGGESSRKVFIGGTWRERPPK